MTTATTIDTPTWVRVAAAVEAMRTGTDLSVTELAQRTGIPRSTLRRRLAGEHPFTVDELYATTEALGVHLAAPFEHANRAAAP